jgi:hopanoid-associated phosphorylase
MIIVVVGLAFEARIAARSVRNVVCSGSGRTLADTLRKIIGPDCHGLLSFGVAGGLRADLTPGTCIVGSAVVDGSNRIPTDREWSQKLLGSLPKSVFGAVAGTSGPVVTTAAKRELHLTTGAIAVDMESHVVAREAARCKLPVAVLRVVCDPAARALPDAAFSSVRDDGTTDVVSLMRSLARRPRQVPAMLRVALDARAARATLVRCGPALSHGLGGTTVLSIPDAVVGVPG